MLARLFILVTLFCAVAFATNSPEYLSSLRVGLKNVLLKKSLDTRLQGEIVNSDGVCDGVIHVQKLTQCFLWLDAVKVTVAGKFVSPAKLELLDDGLFIERIKVTWQPIDLYIDRPCNLNAHVLYKCALGPGQNKHLALKLPSH